MSLHWPTRTRTEQQTRDMESWNGKYKIPSDNLICMKTNREYARHDYQQNDYVYQTQYDSIVLSP